MSSDFAAAVAPPAKKDRHIVSWTQEEDDLLREQVAVNGADNWPIIAAQFKDKTGRQCRRRWLTYLTTDCKKGGWSQEEDMLLCEAQKMYGNRWTEIAKVVPGRTDNAVKNRFTTLCKKRAKHQTVSKENNDSCVHPTNKKIMMEPSENNQHIRYHRSHHTNNFSSDMASTNVIGVRSRPPLTVLTQNFNNLSCFPAQYHLDSRGKPAAYDENANCEVRSSFLRKDDPKVNALLQQAEFLSSLAVKAYSENRIHSLQDAWKELQDYLTQTQEGRNLRTSSRMDSMSNNFKGLFEDFEFVDAEIQLSWSFLKGEVGLEDSQTSSEMSTGCTDHDRGSNFHRNQLDHFSLSCSEETPAPDKNFCQGEVMSSPMAFTQNNESMLCQSKPEFDSPFQTIPPFHSFTEEIPSPEFSSSEKKFLQSVLGVSSSKPILNTKQTPYKRDNRANSNQPYSCKRVLLDSL